MTASNVCAIVVTHQPDISVLTDVLNGLARQVAAVVVVDNDSEEKTLRLISTCAEERGLHLLALKDNLGLGAAHNRGIDYARGQGSQYVLILDQDSVPCAGMVARLVQASETLRASGHRIAAVGPRYVDPTTRQSSFFVRFGCLEFRRVWCDETSAQTHEADFLISSGSLISISAIDEIGGMDEAFFIDHVDTEWFLRARAKGFKSFGVCDAIMTHKLGSETLNVWVGRWRTMPLHSPLRHYYTVRNSILLYRRQYSPRKWIVNDVLRLLKVFCFFVLFAAPRLQHAGMMVRGAWHGLRGRAGRYK